MIEFELSRADIVKWVFTSWRLRLRALSAESPVVFIGIIFALAALPISDLVPVPAVIGDSLSRLWILTDTGDRSTDFFYALWQVMAGTLAVGLGGVLFLYESYNSNPTNRVGLTSAEYSTASDIPRLIGWIAASLLLLGAVALGWGPRIWNRPLQAAGLTDPDFGNEWSRGVAILISAFALLTLPRAFRQLTRLARSAGELHRARAASSYRQVSAMVRDELLELSMRERLRKALTTLGLHAAPSIETTRSAMAITQLQTGVVSDIDLKELRAVALLVDDGAICLPLFDRMAAGRVVAVLQGHPGRLPGRPVIRIDGDHSDLPHVASRRGLNEHYLERLLDDARSAVAGHDHDRLESDIGLYENLMSRMAVLERALGNPSRVKALRDNVAIKVVDALRGLHEHALASHDSAASVALIASTNRLALHFAEVGEYAAAAQFARLGGAMIFNEVLLARDKSGFEQNSKHFADMTHLLAAGHAFYPQLLPSEVDSLLRVALTEWAKIVVLGTMRDSTISSYVWNMWRGFAGGSTGEGAIKSSGHAHIAVTTTILAALLRSQARQTPSAHPDRHWLRIEIQQLISMPEFSGALAATLDDSDGSAQLAALWEEMLREVVLLESPHERVENGIARLLGKAILDGGRLSRNVGQWVRRFDADQTRLLVRPLILAEGGHDAELLRREDDVVHAFATLREVAQRTETRSAAGQGILSASVVYLNEQFQQIISARRVAPTMATAAGAMTEAAPDLIGPERSLTVGRTDLVMGGRHPELRQFADTICESVLHTETSVVIEAWKAAAIPAASDLLEVLDGFTGQPAAAVLYRPTAEGTRWLAEYLPNYDGLIVTTVPTSLVEWGEVLVVCAGEQSWRFCDFEVHPPIGCQEARVLEGAKKADVKLVYHVAVAEATGSAQVWRLTPPWRASIGR